MIRGIASVTVAVPDLRASLRLFATDLGLTVVSDARASVGLLSTWRYPVHESVHLVELAAASEPFGRVRLAAFEDAAALHRMRTAVADTAAGIRRGAVAIDFRRPGEAAEPRMMSAAEGLTLLLPLSAEGRAAAVPTVVARPFSAVWVVSGESSHAARFYTQGLGLLPSPAVPQLSDRAGMALKASLGLAPGTHFELSVYRAPSGRSEVVLVRCAPSGESLVAQVPQVGDNGINLITCPCEDMDELLKRLQACGVEPLSPPTHVGLPNGQPGRVMAARGPSEELFEFIETSD